MDITVKSLVDRSGLSLRQVSRLFGCSARNIYFLYHSEEPSDREKERLDKVWEVVYPYFHGRTHSEVKEVLLDSSQGTSVYHTLLWELEKEGYQEPIQVIGFPWTSLLVYEDNHER